MKKNLFITMCIVATIVGHAQNITSAEVFIDADPGTGKATPLNIGTAGSVVNFTKNISTSALQTGFHFLCLRVKNSDGIWSQFEKRSFFISSDVTTTPDISAAEFFIDKDPGIGRGKKINVSSGATINFVADISTSGLSDGFHFLGIRVKNTQGVWSLIERNAFFISTLSTNTPILIAAEFFLDTDPGIGNAQPVNITPGTDVTQTFSFTLPNGRNDGDHFVGIRFKDADGRWSIFDFDTVNINSALPLRFLSFTGAYNNNINLLQWITTDEINTTYFEIERSSNGVSFEKIGAVNAVNKSNSRNTYTFQDRSPLKGFNFYRLKQFDKDGSYSYSNIIRIAVDDAGEKMIITPNPASNIIHFHFSTAATKLLINIYDANGRMVMVKTAQINSDIQMNIEHLAKGKYFVQVSDGLTQKRGTFIKQ